MFHYPCQLLPAFPEDYIYYMVVLGSFIGEECASRGTVRARVHGSPLCVVAPPSPFVCNCQVRRYVSRFGAGRRLAPFASLYSSCPVLPSSVSPLSLPPFSFFDGIYFSFCFFYRKTIFSPVLHSISCQLVFLSCSPSVSHPQLTLPLLSVPSYRSLYSLCHLYYLSSKVLSPSPSLSMISSM